MERLKNKGGSMTPNTMPVVLKSIEAMGKIMAKQAWKQMKKDINKKIKSGEIDKAKAKCICKGIKIAEKAIRDNNIF